MALFDLVGRRWTLRVIWELHESAEPLTFRELRAACGDVSSSVLTLRLRELSVAAIVTHTGAGYALTPTGVDLVASMRPILEWSHTWSSAIDAAATEPSPSS